MPIYAKSSSQKELIPAGTHIARCYSMIEIGTVKENIMGKEKTLTKVRIGWELPEECRVFTEEKGEQPFVISKEFTLSMHEKSSLRLALKAWRGKDFSEEEAKNFDITKLIGVPCMLNITHKLSKDGTRTYNEIAGITPLHKSMKCPDQVNANQVLSFDNFDQGLFESLPDFIKNKITTSQEYQAMRQPSHKEAVQTEDDDLGLPF